MSVNLKRIPASGPYAVTKMVGNQEYKIKRDEAGTISCFSRSPGSKRPEFGWKRLYSPEEELPRYMDTSLRAAYAKLSGKAQAAVSA